MRLTDLFAPGRTRGWNIFFLALSVLGVLAFIAGLALLIAALTRMATLYS